MNKEWFIFKGTHHLGPFSVLEMEEFFAVGEITGQSLVWREGAEKWEALSKIRELSHLGEGQVKKVPAPPKPYNAKTKLPPIPEEDLPPPMPPVFLGGPEFDDSDLPPPVPLDAILDPKGANKNFKTPPKPPAKVSPRLIFGTVVGIFIMVLGWFFMNEQSSSIQLKVKGVMPVYVEKLQEIAAQKIPSVALSMALSLDGKTLYASTNKDGEILSIIKLTSLPKRTLGTADVELMVRGVIKDHLGVFSKMQLTKGPQFVPGEYNVDFTGRKLHFLNRKFKFLNDYNFFKKWNTDYTYQTQALIYAGTPREFEKKLSEYKDSILNEKLKPINDKLERLQTFLSILNKTAEDYLLMLDKIKNPKDIGVYEKQYMNEISPILQTLILAAADGKKIEDNEPDTRNRIASYASQIQIGKLMGELGSDMITETAKQKKLTDKEKAILRAKFESRYRSIKSQIDSHIIKLQDQIQKISN